MQCHSTELNQTFPTHETWLFLQNDIVEIRLKYENYCNILQRISTTDIFKTVAVFHFEEILLLEVDHCNVFLSKKSKIDTVGKILRVPVGTNMLFTLQKDKFAPILIDSVTREGTYHIVTLDC